MTNLTKLARGVAYALRNLAETQNDAQHTAAVDALKDLVTGLREKGDLFVIGRACQHGLALETIVVDPGTLCRWAKRWELWADAYDTILRRAS